ncbi:NUDIX hydrolase [Solibacillus sp. FSL H8-0538]|uniref:NUDIX hydrolase n=1 Tax=Solibacillus sp. FSL H8-0538 TaxID=2921400 RepID=UPI0030F90ECE
MDLTIKLNETILNCRVAGVLIKEQYVLLHKTVADDFWILPGGRIKVNENSIVALKREMLEELTIEITCDELLWLAENFFEHNGIDYHEYGFYYKIASDHLDVTDEIIYGRESELYLYKWFKIDQLDEIEVYPRFIKDHILDSNFKHFIENR